MAPDDATSELPAVPATAAPVIVPTIASHAAPRRRRRWPWVLLGSLLVALVLTAAGGLWYLSGLIGAGAAIPQPDAGFPMTVTAVDDASVSYTGLPSGWTDQGLAAIASVEGGYVQTTDPVVTARGSGSRTVTDVVLTPAVSAGQAVALDGWYFPRNPAVGLGRDYEDVAYDSPIGPTPAWFIPGPSPTWVVFVHGRSDAPAQGLRIASTVTALGYPMLLIEYRNDPGAPAGNGYGQFGSDEWQDVEAAVQYALDHGAKDVVLAGMSMGGSAALAFVQNSDLAGVVAGVFLDAPATDFGEMVAHGAAEMGLPSFVTMLAKQVASWRYGFDWDAVDYVASAATVATPTLIVQGSQDQTVPPALNERYAAANPEHVTLEVFEGAAHTTAWNVDRSRYEGLLTAFLTRVAPAS